MSMRRRRKKLSSVIYTMDRRLRSVELKKSVFAKAGLSASVDDETETTLPDGTIYAGDAPNAWHRITGAYYYPARVIGSGDRAEIFLAASDSGLEAERGETISMSRLQSSAGSVTILNTDSDPDYFTVRAHGTPNWSLTATNTRKTKQSSTGTKIYFELADTGSGVGHTYLFSPESDSTYSFPPTTLRYLLKFNAAVSKHSATTTTATLTVAATHHYQADDIIDVADLPAGYRGIDGIFKIKAVTSTTIAYDFDEPLTAAIPEANASGSVFVHSVAQKYVRVGSTYINSTEGIVYYWDGIRYTLSAPSGLSNDGFAPSPPTDLNLTTAGYIRTGPDASPRSRVDLSWTAPTTSANGSPLDDLAGYRIFVSETGYSNWTQKITYERAVTSQTIVNLDQDKEYYFRVIAFDSFGLDSTGLDGSIVTGAAALSVSTPSAPVIPTVKFGVVTVKWDGRNSDGGVVPSRLIDHLEVHASTTSGFTPLPGSATLVGKIFSAIDPCVVTNLNYNTTYYFKFIAKDTAGNFTAASVQTSAVVKPLVDTDLIAAQLNSPLSVWPFAPKAVTAGALADGALDASTVFGPDVITQDAIAANAIGADQIAANAITAGKISANAVTSAKIDALAITAGKIAANAVEADKINAGAVTAVKIAANAIEASKILVTDTFKYTNNDGSKQVLIGSDAIYGQTDSSGLSFTGADGVSKGWLGSWFNAIELGTDFALNFIDMYYNNDTSWYSDGDINITSGGTFLNISGKSVDISGSTETSVGTTSTATTVYGQLRSPGGYAFTNAFVPNMRIDSNGYIHRTTHANSSLRYKTAIRPLDFDIEAFMGLTPVFYKYNPDTVPSVDHSIDYSGFIAEDLDAAGFKDLVEYDEENRPDALRYDRFTAYLHAVIKNQATRIEALEKQIGQG